MAPSSTGATRRCRACSRRAPPSGVGRRTERWLRRRTDQGDDRVARRGSDCGVLASGLPPISDMRSRARAKLNLMQSPRNNWGSKASVPGKIRKIEKFPVLFPVSRGFPSGDGFETTGSATTQSHRSRSFLETGEKCRIAGLCPLEFVSGPCGQRHAGLRFVSSSENSVSRRVSDHGSCCHSHRLPAEGGPGIDDVG
jgi:hypothetical protein